MKKQNPQPGWQVIIDTELRRLWWGWRGPLLLFIFSLFCSVYILLLARNPEQNVLSQRKIIDLSIQATVLVGIVAMLLLGANTFSGERDQRSLESLLLTPVPRSQLMTGKLAAILTVWLGMLPIAIPYILLVSRGTGVGWAAVKLLIVPGTMLVALSAALSVLISGFSPTNLVSFATGLAILLLLAAPTQLPGSVQDLPLIHWFIVANPVTAVATFAAAVIDGDPWRTGLSLLVSPIVALALVFGPGTQFLAKWLTLPGGFKR